MSIGIEILPITWPKRLEYASQGEWQNMLQKGVASWG
jgi:hypothetical protein